MAGELAGSDNYSSVLAQQELLTGAPGLIVTDHMLVPADYSLHNILLVSATIPTIGNEGYGSMRLELLSNPKAPVVFPVASRCTNGPERLGGFVTGPYFEYRIVDITPLLGQRATSGAMPLIQKYSYASTNKATYKADEVLVGTLSNTSMAQGDEMPSKLTLARAVSSYAEAQQCIELCCQAYGTTPLLSGALQKCVEMAMQEVQAIMPNRRTLVLTQEDEPARASLLGWLARMASRRSLKKPS